MPDSRLISELPPPPQLALPLAARSELRVRIGEQVAAGAVVADGGADAADTLAPLAGRVKAFAPRPLAAGGEALCVILEQVQAAPPPLMPVQAASLPLLLKRAGIVGLGGGAFPAWRKWRNSLKFFIANGLETEPAACHDAALIAEAGSGLLQQVALVAEAFCAEALLALPQETTPHLRHAMIRRLPPRYALGNERLLIARLCELQIPPHAVAADYGVVCFNIATVLAMAQALHSGQPLCRRMITLHYAGERRALRLPPGATVGDVRRFINTAAAAVAGGDDELQPADDAAVINAAVTVLRFGAPPPPPEAACIRCGECNTVCPVGLSPLRLYQLAQDAHLEKMAAHRLMDCLACRACDEVCPSEIRLAALFIKQKKRLAARQAQSQQIEQRRRRFDVHQQRLAQSERRISPAALRRYIAAAVKKANS